MPSLSPHGCAEHNRSSVDWVGALLGHMANVPAFTCVWWCHVTDGIRPHVAHAASQLRSHEPVPLTAAADVTRRTLFSSGAMASCRLAVTEIAAVCSPDALSASVGETSARPAARSTTGTVPNGVPHEDAFATACRSSTVTRRARPSKPARMHSMRHASARSWPRTAAHMSHTRTLPPENELARKLSIVTTCEAAEWGLRTVARQYSARHLSLKVYVDGNAAPQATQPAILIRGALGIGGVYAH